MVRMVVQLAGTSGSGKSTALKHIWNNSENRKSIWLEDYPVLSISTADATFFEEYNVLVVGSYHNDCGGCDKVTGNGGLAKVNHVIDTLLQKEEFEDTLLIFEGLLMGSYVNMTKVADICDQHEVPYMVIHCDPPELFSIQRVQNRNGGKELRRTDSLVGRARSLRRIMPKFALDNRAVVYRWDTTECQKHQMYQEMMWIIDNYEMLRTVNGVVHYEQP